VPLQFDAVAVALNCAGEPGSIVLGTLAEQVIVQLCC